MLTEEVSAGYTPAGGMRALESPEGPVWYCVRRHGVELREGWLEPTPLAALRERTGAGEADTVEACIVGGFRTVSANEVSETFTRSAQGLLGAEVTFGGQTARFAPLRTITTNRRVEKTLEDYRKRREYDALAFVAGAEMRCFTARQILLGRGADAAPVELVRGATPVAPQPAPGEHRARALADGIETWVRRNAETDGRLPYKYWPSREAESDADNAIRRFLAAWGLARLAAARGGAAATKRARKVLRWNLARYLRPLDGGRAAIVERDTAKLGASALAGLAILEHERLAREFAEELRMLAATVASLRKDDHNYHTFLFPAERDGENWNFYSGEALLFESELARRGACAVTDVAECAETLDRCRTLHFARPNPAFIPWHTQACWSLYAQTALPAIARYAFEMNDRLLSLQQWEGVAPDLKGRFYAPERPDLGPPHAASTGVYVEGLVDAHAMARWCADAERAARYEQAIARGLRSLRQLQFRGPADTWYLRSPERALGALRTEAYDNTIRIDNMGHALLAAVKMDSRGLGEGTGAEEG